MKKKKKHKKNRKENMKCQYAKNEKETRNKTKL